MWQNSTKLTQKYNTNLKESQFNLLKRKAKTSILWLLGMWIAVKVPFVVRYSTQLDMFLINSSALMPRRQRKTIRLISILHIVWTNLRRNKNVVWRLMLRQDFSKHQIEILLFLMHQDIETLLVIWLQERLKRTLPYCVSTAKKEHSSVVGNRRENKDIKARQGSMLA